MGECCYRPGDWRGGRNWPRPASASAEAESSSIDRGASSVTRPPRITLRAALAVVGIAAAGAVIVYSLWLNASYVQTSGPSIVAARPAQHDPSQLAVGRAVYVQHCASCHGAKLEGQPNWRERLPNGRMPAPPHDDSGHTWHHPDDVLFGIVKQGLVPPYAPPKYESDMPAFGSVLTDDDIRAVLGYIESHWSPQVLEGRAALIRQAAEARRN